MREADKRMYYIVSPNGAFAYNHCKNQMWRSIGILHRQREKVSDSTVHFMSVFKTSDDVDDRLLWH